MPLENSALPVSVELIVDDPTTGALPRDRIHLGYDARETRAPRLFRSLITLGEEPNGDPRVQLENHAGYGLNTSPAALTVVGGLFDGESLDRSDPLGGRLTYTPMPPTSTVDLGIGERYRVGLGASTPVTLDAEVEMVAGANEKRATAHLAPLPQSVEASYIPGATADQRTVTVTSSAVVGDVDLAYRDTDGGVPLLGAVVHASDLPTQVTVAQTAERAGTIDTNGAFGSVEFGLADGDPVLGTVDGPYVNLVDDGTHSSVAARIDGLRRASVDATDTIAADIEVTPAGRKPVAIDVQRPGLVVTGSVEDLPEHLTLDADLDGPVVTYDGHGQGLDDLTIEAVADAPLFARATHLSTHATDIPAAFVFEVRKRHQEPTPGVVLLDGIEVTSSAPIGTVEFEADDGGASLLPAQAGATYVDTPLRFAIAARVDDFERVSLIRRLGGWTDLGTTVGAGPFHVKVQTNDPTVSGDALLIEGDVADLPHVLDASVRPPSEQHDGALLLEASADIDALDLRVEPQLPLMERPGADPDIIAIGLEGIPSELEADIVASDTGASVSLDNAIGEVEALLTSGPIGQIGDDGDDSGIYVRALSDQFVAMGRLSDVTALSFAADPIAVDVTTLQAQPFTIDAEVDDPDGRDARRDHRGRRARPARRGLLRGGRRRFRLGRPRRVDRQPHPRRRQPARRQSQRRRGALRRRGDRRRSGAVRDPCRDRQRRRRGRRRRGVRPDLRPGLRHRPGPAGRSRRGRQPGRCPDHRRAHRFRPRARPAHRPVRPGQRGHRGHLRDHLAVRPRPALRGRRRRRQRPAGGESFALQQVLPVDDPSGLRQPVRVAAPDVVQARTRSRRCSTPTSAPPARTDR